MQIGEHITYDGPAYVQDTGAPVRLSGGFVIDDITEADSDDRGPIPAQVIVVPSPTKAATVVGASMITKGDDGKIESRRFVLPDNYGKED